MSGFSSQESDDEITGSRSHYSYEYRVHDARTGRFFSVDPVYAKYAYNSTYAFSENRLIDGIELEGLEVFFIADGKYLKQIGTSVELRVVNDAKVIDIYEKTLSSINGPLISEYEKFAANEKYLFDNSSELYTEDKLMSIFKKWGDEVLPKSANKEFAIMIYSHTFYNKDGTSFLGLLPGTTVSNGIGKDDVWPYDYLSQLRIGEQKIAYQEKKDILNIKYFNPFNYQFYAAIHTHPQGGDDRREFSLEDMNITLSKKIPLYMIQYNSKDLFYFDNDIYHKHTRVPFKYADNPGTAGFDKTAAEIATIRTKDFYR